MSIAWYVIPTTITILALAWAFFWPTEEREGAYGGLVTLFMLLPAALVIAMAWMAAAILK